MRITKRIGDLIVMKTKELTQLNINVMDKSGVIISSSDSERIGMLHQGAAEAVRLGEEVTVTDTEQWVGAKPGMNMPIIFHSEVIGVIGITGEQSEVGPFGRAVRMMTELLLQQSYLTEQVELKERSKVYLAQELISQESRDREALDSLYMRGELLGIDLKLPRAILLLELKFIADTRVYRIHPREIEALFPAPEETLMAQLARGRWIVLADVSAYSSSEHAKQSLTRIASDIRSLMLERFQAETIITIGRTCQQVQHIGQAFEEAAKLLELVRLHDDDQPVVHVEDAGLAYVLSEISAASSQRLIRQVLGELVTHPHLLDTLQAFFDHGMNLHRTAGAISIHRNTLLYRLDRIASLTGRDPRQFHEAVNFQVAMMMRRRMESLQEFV
ncbi:CdaR family transcriptional regulator [Paenibacillus chungangensis]|uniref:CdaR family transcriptional regulator n=1 Tax=Paenibacillus chungangensis TaxID=696535 RepID=A0ABW3HL22_9BACL